MDGEDVAVFGRGLERLRGVAPRLHDLGCRHRDFGIAGETRRRHSDCQLLEDGWIDIAQVDRGQIGRLQVKRGKIETLEHCWQCAGLDKCRRNEQSNKKRAHHDARVKTVLSKLDSTALFMLLSLHQSDQTLNALLRLSLFPRLDLRHEQRRVDAD